MARDTCVETFAGPGISYISGTTEKVRGTSEAKRQPRMKTLLLFTGSYPYSAAAENTFLPQELEVVRDYFRTVVVIPASIEGDRVEVSGGNVTVNTDYAEFARSRLRRMVCSLRGLIDPEFIAECVRQSGMFLRHPQALKRALAEYARSRIARRWMRKFETMSNVSVRDCVVCTWWFDGLTWGASSFARAKGAPAITRAHGYDLYESRHHPPYIPFRTQSLQQVTSVYADSDAGARHLVDRYPAFSSKIKVGRLGVHDPEFTNVPSRDGTFRLLSCSFLLPVKRINLVIEGLAELGRRYPGRKLQWTHIGSGPERTSLEQLAGDILPGKVTYRFIDYPGQDRLIDFYRNEPVDMFVNVSQSEGTPVSIMEAISVGIPVIATAVGGNKEIVGAENGILIVADPGATDVADAIASLLDDGEKLARLRNGSRRTWQNAYSARRNYAQFAQSICNLT